MIVKITMNPDFDDLPKKLQRVIANMMFNTIWSKIIQIQGYERGVDPEIGKYRRRDLMKKCGIVK